jgi:hypothetical protein
VKSLTDSEILWYPRFIEARAGDHRQTIQLASRRLPFSSPYKLDHQRFEMLLSNHKERGLCR